MPGSFAGRQEISRQAGDSPLPPVDPQVSAPRSRRELIRKIAWTWVFLAGAYYVFDLVNQWTDGLSHASGRAFGDDFINYWSGAFLAWHHRAAEIYRLPAFHAFQQ